MNPPAPPRGAPDILSTAPSQETAAAEPAGQRRLGGRREAHFWKQVGVTWPQTGLGQGAGPRAALAWLLPQTLVPTGPSPPVSPGAGAPLCKGPGTDCHNQGPRLGSLKQQKLLSQRSGTQSP